MLLKLCSVSSPSWDHLDLTVEQLIFPCRERYEDLIRQCQMMHSSVGTGELAYVVGSKVMDVRTMSKDNTNNNREEATTSWRAARDSANRIEENSESNNGYTETLSANKRKSCSNSAELGSFRESTDSPACNSTYNSFLRSSENEFDEPKYDTESFYDFPPLPVTNLFWEGDGDEDSSFYATEQTLGFQDGQVHSFQINNNVDLIMESTSSSNDVSRASNSGTERNWAKNGDFKKEIVDGLRISDAPEEAIVNGTTTSSLVANEDRVSEWLWTLHRIGKLAVLWLMQETPINIVISHFLT